MTNNALIKNYAQQEVRFEKGKGSYLYSKDGKKYLDCGCGISVTNLGHCNDHVNKAIIHQVNTLWHTSNIFPNDIVEKLAARISEASFGKIFFCNSGAEANEAAIKLVRLYSNKLHGGKKHRIITMLQGFHGRTYATMSATGQDKIQKGFEPMASFITYVPFNDLGAVKRELEKGDVGAVILELFQGESGVLPAENDFIKGVRELTKKHEALMILDEVQTGFGRTGKLFAYQHTDIIPDAFTCAKAMGNGIPMGALVAKDEYAELFTYGTHGSTFGGNLLACAASHAVLDIMLEKDFFPKVVEKGEYAMKKLSEILAKNGGSVRGRGLLIGLKLPEKIKSSDFIKKALENGLVVIGGGADSIRFYPPLNVSYEELDEGISLVEKVLTLF